MTHEALSLSAEHLSTLVQLAGELTSEVRLPALLDRILTQAARLTESAAGSVILYDDRQRRPYVAHAIGPDSDTVRSNWGAGGVGIPIVGSKAGGVFTSGVPIIVNDIARDPEHFKAVDRDTQAPTRTMICVPLAVSDARVGVVRLINREHGDYTAYDQALLRRAHSIRPKSPTSRPRTTRAGRWSSSHPPTGMPHGSASAGRSVRHLGGERQRPMVYAGRPRPSGPTLVPWRSGVLGMTRPGGPLDSTPTRC